MASLLAIVGDDHQVGIYDQANQLYVDHIGIHTDWIRATRFSPDGQILVTAGNDRTVRFWATSDWETPAITKNHQHAIIEVAFAHQQPWLATVGFEKTLMIYDARQGREVQQLTCGCKDNHAVAFSADDRLIAAGGRNGTIRIWDVASGKLNVEITASPQSHSIAGVYARRQIDQCWRRPTRLPDRPAKPGSIPGFPSARGKTVRDRYPRQ